MLEFHNLKNGQYFLWMGTLFEKIRDVFEVVPSVSKEPSLQNGIAKTWGGFDPQNCFGKQGHLFLNPQGEGNFNPYGLVEPVQVDAVMVWKKYTPEVPGVYLVHYPEWQFPLMFDAYIIKKTVTDDLVVYHNQRHDHSPEELRAFVARMDIPYWYGPIPMPNLS